MMEQGNLAAIARYMGVRIPLNSSALAWCQYQPTLEGYGELTIGFHDGNEIQYSDISVSTFLGFISAGSKGAYYNQHIRGQ